MITFQLETFEEWHRDVGELALMHQAETGTYPERLRLNLNAPVYAAVEKADRLRILTVRDGRRLIGYYVLFLMFHNHYCDVLVSGHDGHFLHPDYRKGTGLGMELLRRAEQIARDGGAKLHMMRSKAKSGHGRLYQRLGYDLMDETYTKWLGG